MKQVRFSLALAIAVALLGAGLWPTVQPVVAQGSSTHITSAVFSIFVQDPSNQTVRLHRISAPWAEQGVTWASFGGAYYTSTLASFVTASSGWHTTTVTSLVQDWVDNPTQNYGLLLEQGNTPYGTYTSSEDFPTDERPKLDVCYTRNGGPETCLTIQRPGAAQDRVADTYIWEGLPDYNGGDSILLYTGLFSGPLGTGIKYTLLRFELTTPTAVQLQSLSARSSVAPELALAAVGVVSVAGLIVLRRRRIF